jgi:hypothetical protein
MRVRYSVLVLVLVLVGLGGLTSSAQAPAAKPAAAAPAVPAMDDLDKALVDNVVLARQLANSACQALDSVKQYQAVLANSVTKIEAKHPGYTLDTNTGLLMVKPPAAAAAKP